MILYSQRPSGGSNDSFLPPSAPAQTAWPQTGCALARHATWTGSGTLIQTLQLIHHQQARGSSPRVGSNICKRLRTDDTSSQNNVSPQCHHIAGAQPRHLPLACVPTVTPAHAAPMR